MNMTPLHLLIYGLQTEFPSRMKLYSHLLASVSGNKTWHCRNVKGAWGQLPGDTRYRLTSLDIISSLGAY